MKWTASSKCSFGMSGKRSATSWNGAYSTAPCVSSRHLSIQRRQKWQSPSKISNGFPGGFETDERDIAQTFGLPRRTSTQRCTDAALSAYQRMIYCDAFLRRQSAVATKKTRPRSGRDLRVLFLSASRDQFRSRCISRPTLYLPEPRRSAGRDSLETTASDNPTN